MITEMTVVLNYRKDVLGGFSFAKYFDNIVKLHVCIPFPFDIYIMLYHTYSLFL
jgi:hypothetical protein